jgi:hypothetical protein
MTAKHDRASVAFIAATGGALVVSSVAAWYANRRRRSRWSASEHKDERDVLHSIIDEFKALELDPETTVEEANKRRTSSYYLKAREAHSRSLVLGISPPSQLKKLRQVEVDRNLAYFRKGNQSHRTICTMCDETTQTLLDDARKLILGPLNHSNDITTKGAWIPDLNVIPKEDMHVTVAITWWWHTIRPGNDDLTRDMASRFKQTLLLKFHYAFQVELERIVILGGRVLVALWRCVGHREDADGNLIYDRHGETIDPFVSLREEIVRCFTTSSPDFRRQPLTYQHMMSSGENEKSDGAFKSDRQHTIEKKTPGMGKMGKADGFIHTTLCRLPLECLSSNDVELNKIHRLCREATATLSGHRMVISKYRFIETMGEGGESNPCFKPVYDETIDAPIRHKVKIDGKVSETSKLHPQENLTIGATRNFMTDSIDNNNKQNGMGHKRVSSDLMDLFQPPEEGSSDENSGTLMNLFQPPEEDSS